jgi:hypothetical protein
MCLSAQAPYRLDCGQDDYFSVTPRRGSWLARHPRNNIANSRFLEVTAPVDLPSAPWPPTGVVRTPTTIQWNAQPGVRYDVGYVKFDGDVVWVAQDVVGGQLDVTTVSARRLHVRAVNDAGYSDRVVAQYQ